MLVTAGQRQLLLFFCPFFLGEGLPLAVLLRANQRGPTFGLRIEPELVSQRAILKIEPKLDAEQVWIKLATTRAGVVPAENIHPMTHITFRGVIKSDEHERFIFLCFSAGVVMKLNELVLQHPFAAHSAFNHASVAHFPGNTPVADEIIEERVPERQRRGRSKQNGTEQYKQNHCRSRCNKHNKLDLLMVFHFHSATNAFRSRNQFFDLNQTSRKLYHHAQGWLECFVDCLYRYLSLPGGG